MADEKWMRKAASQIRSRIFRHDDTYEIAQGEDARRIIERDDRAVVDIIRRHAPYMGDTSDLHAMCVSKMREHLESVGIESTFADDAAMLAAHKIKKLRKQLADTDALVRQAVSDAIGRFEDGLELFISPDTVLAAYNRLRKEAQDG